jgi:hypothetical protein
MGAPTSNHSQGRPRPITGLPMEKKKTCLFEKHFQPPLPPSPHPPPTQSPHLPKSGSARTGSDQYAFSKSQTHRLKLHTLTVSENHGCYLLFVTRAIL